MSKNYVFNTVPRIYYRRSVQDLSHGHLTTGNVGDLIPFYCQEVYPGDSMRGVGTVVVRSTTPFIKPVFGNLFVDMMYFFVPSRLLVNDFGRLFGENTSGAWAPSSTPSVRKIGITSIDSHTVASYLGVPLVSSITVPVVSSLPFRAFALVYNDWFRDENLIPPMQIFKTWAGESGGELSISTNDWSPANYTGRVPKVSKTHDYFTSCLPAPQKGAATDIPVELGYLPVITRAAHIPNLASLQTMNWNLVGGAQISSGDSRYLGIQNTTPVSDSNVRTTITNSTAAGMANNLVLYPSNLWTDATNAGASFSVTDLRFSTAIQRILERSGRSGSRYIEYIRSCFGVEPGDVRMMRPEYLGGSRNPVNIQQVAQTTGSSETDNMLGELGAFSLSSGQARFNKGFTEHGYILGVM